MRSLTLVPDLQSKAQNARGGKPGVVIVMDPMTGAVLALDQSTPDQALGQARDPGTLRRIALAAGIDVDHREAPANLCHQSVSDALAGGPACSAKDVESFFNRLSGYHNLMSSLCTLGFGGASASATLGPLRIAGSTIGDSTDSGCSPDASANKEPMPVTPLQEAVITSVFVRAAPPIPGQPPSVTAQCAHFIENQGPDVLPEIGGAKCRAGTDLKIKPEIARQVVQGMQGAANVPDHHDIGLLSDEPSGAGWATGFAVLNGRALVVTVVLPGDSAVHAADTALSVLK
jgi:hypothetical protein